MRNMGRLVVVGFALVLAGCSSPPVAMAPVAAPTQSPMPCNTAGTHEDCSRVLTKVILAASDSYDALSSPSTEQDAAYRTVTGTAHEWDACAAASTMPLGDDIKCLAIVERISAAALVIDPTLDD